MKKGVPKSGTWRMKSGTWLMSSVLHMKKGAWSFSEFQMNIFARTLDVSTTLPLAA